MIFCFDNQHIGISPPKYLTTGVASIKKQFTFAAPLQQWSGVVLLQAGNTNQYLRRDFSLEKQASIVFSDGEYDGSEKLFNKACGF